MQRSQEMKRQSSGQGKLSRPQTRKICRPTRQKQRKTSNRVRRGNKPTRSDGGAKQKRTESWIEINRKQNRSEQQAKYIGQKSEPKVHVRAGTRMKDPSRQVMHTQRFLPPAKKTMSKRQNELAGTSNDPKAMCKRHHDLADAIRNLVTQPLI